VSARRRPPEPTGSPARGGLLIIIAVILGLVLLRNGIDTDLTSGTSAAGSKRTTTTASPDATTTTTLPVKPPAQVKVLVLNGSSKNGAAQRAADALKAKGYVTLPSGNATAVTATIVYFVPGFEREAKAVAAALGSPPLPAVAPLPATPPAPAGDANVVVVLGPDKAT
jgi:hypothetical protein